MMRCHLARSGRPYEVHRKKLLPEVLVMGCEPLLIIIDVRKYLRA